MKTCSCAFLFTAVALLGGCSEPAEEAAPPRPVAWATVETAADGSVRPLPGVLRRPSRAPVAFEVPGRVETLPVALGDSFAAGDLLATIDDRSFRLALARRRAELAEAEAELQLAEADFRRSERLLGDNAISEADFDAARARLGATQGRVDTVTALVRLAEEDLADARLLAPYAGAVAARLVEPAEQVQPGQPVLEIQGAGNGFEIVVAVPETLVAALAQGQRHSVAIPVAEGGGFAAVVREVSADTAEGNAYTVVLDLEGDTAALRAGMTAEVRFDLAGAMNAGDWLSVPVTAYVAEGEGKRGVVYVIDGDPPGAVRRAVVLEALRGDRALLSGKLAAGERVVSRGAAFVRDGQPLALLDADPRRFNP